MKRLYFVLVVMFLASFVLVPASLVSAQDQPDCTWPAGVFIPGSNVQQDFGESWTVRTIGSDCMFAYGTYQTWLLSDSDNESLYTNVSYVFWQVRPGEVTQSKTNAALNAPGMQLAAAEVVNGKAEFYFVNFLPSTGYVKVVMDEAGESTAEFIEASQVPAEVMSLLRAPTVCGLMSDFEIWEKFAQTWDVPADVRSLSMDKTPVSQLSDFNVCDVMLVTIFVIGDQLKANEYSFSYGVSFYVYAADSNSAAIISEPISDGETDYIRYPLQYEIGLDGLFVTDWYLSGELHQVNVTPTGGTQQYTSFRWESVIYAAIELDHPYEPIISENAIVPDITYLDLAIRLPHGPSSTDLVGTSEWYAMQSQVAFSFGQWTCMSPDCTVQMLTIYQYPDGATEFENAFHWDVFAVLDADGNWQISDFTHGPGTALVKASNVVPDFDDSHVVYTCFIADNEGRTTVNGYAISKEGRVEFTTTQAVCPSYFMPHQN